MGQVFLARQKGPVGFQKLLVVKRLLPHLSEDTDFIKMFLDEARIAGILNHPNIAQIYELGDVDGVLYIAMEYVQGEAVSQVNARANQRKGGLPLGLKCRIIADAAAGLDHAHQARSPSGRKLGLIHRDVSPQNVLVGFNGNVKLIDFGVAKVSNKLSHTVVGTIKGKHAYMSPEQARDEELDARSDVYGLGIVFYELLTSQRLFKRESDMATLKAVVGAKVIPPSEAVPGIPRSLDAVVMKALARRREERFQSAGEAPARARGLPARRAAPGHPGPPHRLHEGAVLLGAGGGALRQRAHRHPVRSTAGAGDELALLDEGGARAGPGAAGEAGTGSRWRHASEGPRRRSGSRGPPSHRDSRKWRGHRGVVDRRPSALAGGQTGGSREDPWEFRRLAPGSRLRRAASGGNFSGKMAPGDVTRQTGVLDRLHGNGDGRRGTEGIHGT
ncbi:serine/threonine-protein kinase [Archangium gephyra]|uniref:serine/threonine-protein kinase n=1 Tax=Archangium gephyra TaxID=48 RepID=UPI003B7DC410